MKKISNKSEIPEFLRAVASVPAHKRPIVAELSNKLF